MQPSAPAHRAPASAWQEALFAQALDGRCNFTIALAAELAGPLDEDALHRTLADIVARHEALRTTLHRTPAGVEQRIWRAAPVALERLTLPGASEATLSATLAQLADRPCELEGGALMRATLIVLGKERHALLLALHHAIVDGTSWGILWTELWALYAASATGTEAALPPVRAQYRDHAEHERHAATPANREHWRRLLRERGARPRLPPPEATGRAEGDWNEGFAALPPEALRRLAELASAERASPAMALRAAIAAWLAGMGGETATLADVHVNRSRPSLFGTVGFLAETATLQIPTGGAPTHRELIGRVRASALDEMSHRMPMWDVLATAGHDPLVDEPYFDVEVNQQPTPSADALAGTVGELSLEVRPLHLSWAQRNVRFGRELLIARCECELSALSGGGLRTRLRGPWSEATCERLAVEVVDAIERLTAKPDLSPRRPRCP